MSQKPRFNFKEFARDIASGALSMFKGNAVSKRRAQAIDEAVEERLALWADKLQALKHKET